MKTLKQRGEEYLNELKQLNKKYHAELEVSEDKSPYISRTVEVYFYTVWSDEQETEEIEIMIEGGTVDLGGFIGQGAGYERD